MAGNNAGAFQEYGTPRFLFDAMHAAYEFTIDAAASRENALLPRYFTKEQDGLLQDWSNERVFCNPPYARWQLFRWVEKAAVEAKRGALVVMLVPASVETVWFHQHCWDAAVCRAYPWVEVHFLKERPRFVDPRNKAKSPKGWRPLQACMVLVFRPRSG